MRKVDITEKLELGGNPCLVIAGQELEVNADAATMLKLMGKFSDIDDEAMSAKTIMELYEIVFPEASRKKVEELKLSFKDLTVVIQCAQKVIVGEDPNAPQEEQPGEDQTHTTI